jgi:hypothetical protein
MKMGDLSSDKRAELLARRGVLRKQIELKKQRDTIAFFLDPLDAAGIPYELGYFDRDGMRWLEPLFNDRLETFQQLRDVMHGEYPDREEMVAWMKHVVEENELTDGPVVFASDNLYQPTVRLLLSDLLRAPKDPFHILLGGHNWIMRENERWTFEIHHADIYWGRVPG